MAEVTMKQLLEAGVHFGHQTSRWNPKMKPYIFGARNGIYIIDLQQTVTMLADACSFVRDLAARGGSLLMVGTKKQAQDAVLEEAERCGVHYVSNRWLGGTLTNFQTVKQSVERLKKLEEMLEDPVVTEALKKRELLEMSRERDRLIHTLGGIKTMRRVPDALFVIDTLKEEIAVKEANKLGIPVVAVVDSNCDPDPVEWRIPGNDDAIRAIRLFCAAIADSVEEGRASYDERSKAEEAEAAPDQTGIAVPGSEAPLAGSQLENEAAANEESGEEKKPEGAVEGGAA
jgi:small subunit ribosomal protein S2